MNPSPTDRIEKTVVLSAPRERVWRALTNSAEFGAWFGLRLSGGLEPGSRIRGVVTLPGYEHVTWNIEVERVEHERSISWRWYPYSVERGVDYSMEPFTLVEFALEDLDEGRLAEVREWIERIEGRRDEARGEPRD